MDMKCGGNCDKGFKCMQANVCLHGLEELATRQPTTWEELCLRQAFNIELTGDGLETTMHMACPGCGAPEFMVYRIMDSVAAMNAGGHCTECLRGFRMPIERIKCEHGHDHGTTFKIVQTVGPDLPAWFKLRIERVMQGN